MRCFRPLPIRDAIFRSTGVSMVSLNIIGYIAIACLVPAMPFCYVLELLKLGSENSCDMPVLFFCEKSAVKYAETIPQTSATILGLTNFGFLLGIRLSGPHRGVQRKSLGIAYVAIFVMIMLQMMLMMYAHGDMLYLPFYWYAMSITTIALLVIGYSFVYIVVMSSRLGAVDTRYRENMRNDVSSSHDPGSGG